jgi:hypothetical protein
MSVWVRCQAVGNITWVFLTGGAVGGVLRQQSHSATYSIKKGLDPIPV